MAANLARVLQHLRRLSSTAVQPVSDAVLLERFRARRDEESFAALVARHGPMVRKLCGRILANTQDAEDAFQATFLILARKAAVVRPPTLASWLYGVAYRVACKARGAAARGKFQPLPLDVPDPHADPLADVCARELLTLFEEELRRLPEVYRLPIILCCLQGRSQEEAARQLGWTPGSLQGRLERGRARLHARLARRGVSFAAAMLMLEAVQGAAPAAVPPAGFVSSLLHAARLSPAAMTGDGAITPRVLVLAQEAMRSMAVAKAKIGLVLLLAVSAIAAGTGMLVLQVRQERESQAQPIASPQRLQQPSALASQAPRVDRYGDSLPPGALARMGTIRFRHGDVIEAISLSSDGRTLVAASRDRTVRLWDTATGREVRRLPGHEGQGPAGFGSLRYVAFSPDGKMLATGVSYSGIVRLWDAATGKELRKLQSPDRGWLGHVAFSADAKLLAASADKHCIMLWEMATGRLVHQLDGKEKNNFAGPIAFSPDGKTLASGGLAETLRLWDLKTGKEIRRFLVQPPWPKEKSGSPFLSGLVEGVAFSPDGRILASASKDAPVRLWDVATGKEIRSSSGNRYGAYSLAFAPDGKTLASGEAEGMIRVWETASGKEVRRIKAHNAWVSGLAYVRDGKTLVSSGDSAIRLWDAHTCAEILPMRGHTTGIASTVLLPDGRTVVTGSDDNTIRWWDLATGKELRRLESLTDPALNLGGMVLSPNGAIAAYHKQKSVSEREAQLGIELWDLTARKKLALLWRPNIFGAQFSPDSKTLYTQVADILSEKPGSLILAWDVATGEELRVLAKNTNGFGGFRLSADGKVLAATTYGPDKTIFVSDVATGKELCRIARNSPFNQCLTISPDNKLLAVADGPPSQAGGNEPPHYLRLWDIATGKEVRRFGRSKSAYWPVSFSADGRTLATAGWNNQIRLWETATGGERRRFAGHAGRVGDLLFAENDRTLLSSSSDTTALVWDLTGLRSATPAAEVKRPSRDLQVLWNTLSDPDATAAYRALWALAAVPTEAITFLRKRLVRVETPEEKTISRLVLDLDSPVFATRQRATEELTKLDRLAEPALRKALTGQPSLEMRRRVQELLEQSAAAPTGEHIRQLRAVETLEHIGTADAQAVLKTLASGAANARLTREAKASLERLDKRRTVQP